MNYNPSLGIFGNLKRLYEERNKTNATVYNNREESERSLLEASADMVEAVIDEFNAFMGEGEE